MQLIDFRIHSAQNIINGGRIVYESEIRIKTINKISRLSNSNYKYVLSSGLISLPILNN